MAKGDDKIELTRSELADMIAREVKTALAPMAQDTAFHAEIAQRKGTDRAPLPSSVVKNVTLPSGAVADVKIDHRGIAVEFPTYAHPDGVDRKLSDGGLVPDGFKVEKDPSQPGYAMYQQWLYDGYFLPDLNAIIGKPLPKHLIPVAA